MVVMETVELCVDGEHSVWGAERPTGPHLHREPIHIATGLQTTIQNRLLRLRGKNITGVCIILATLKNTELTSILGSGYIHTVLKLTSIYGS